MEHKMLPDTLKRLGRYLSYSITAMIVFVMLIAGYSHGGIKGFGRIAALFSLFFVGPLLLIQTGKLFKWIYAIIKDRQKISYIISVIALAFFVPSFAEAASTYEVYTYGNGDFLAAIFNGVAMMFNSGSILYGLIKIAAIILLLFAVVTPLAGAFTGKGAQMNAGAGLLPMIQVPLIMAFVIYGVMTPKANLSIIDRQDPGQSQVISNVPLVHTYLAHAISTIGDKLGEEFETVFGQVDGLKFRNGGVGIGAKYTGSLMSIYPPSSSMVGADTGTTLITQVLREYFVRCVFPNFASLDGSAGSTTAALDKLFTSENVPADLKASTTLFNSVHTTIMGITTEEANCQEAIDQVYDKWNSVSAIWLKDIETKLAGGVGSAGIVGNASINLGGGTLTETVKDRYFPGSTLTSTDMLIHIATLNLMRDSVQSYLAVTGNPTDTATALSRKQSSSGWLTSAKMLNTIVHTMRNLIEGLAYGLSVLLPVFFFVGSLSPLITFAKILLWLQLWVPFYVVLNLFADMEYARAINNIFTNEVAKGPTYRTYDLIASQTELTLGYVGAVSWSVPSFAWALVSGVSAGMSAVAGAMSTGSGAQSSAQSAGGNIATGGATEMAKAEASRWGTSANVQTSMHGFDKTMQNYLGAKDSGVGLGGLRQTAEVTAGASYGDALGTKKVAESSGKSVVRLHEDMTAKTKTAENQEINRVGNAEEAGILKGDKNANSSLAFGEAQEKSGNEAMIDAEGGKMAGDVDAIMRNAKAAGLPPGMEGVYQQQLTKNNGTMGEAWARAANMSKGFKADEGPYKGDMIPEKFNVDGNGNMNVTKASMQNKDGSTTTLENGQVTTRRVADADNVKALQTEVNGSKELSNKFGVAAGDLKAGMVTTETRDFSGNLVGFKGEQVGQTDKTNTAGTDIGQRHKDKDIHDHVLGSEKEAELINKKMEEAGYENVNFKKGDSVYMEGKSGTMGEGRNFLKNIKADELSVVQGKRGGSEERFDIKQSQTGQEHSHKDIKTGNMVMGDDKKSQAFMKTFNAGIDQKIDEMMNTPGINMSEKHADTLRDQSYIRQGDHVQYSANTTDGTVSDFNVTRGGQRQIGVSATTTAGNSTDIKQDSTTQTVGTEYRGSMAGGALGDAMQKMGFSRDTAKFGENILGGAQKALGEVSNVLGGIRNVRKAGQGSVDKDKLPQVVHPRPDPNDVGGSYTPWGPGVGK